MARKSSMKAPSESPKPARARPSLNGGHRGPAVRCACSALVEVGKLNANPRNPNRHPDRQLDLYAKVIKHQGWRRAVVVSNQSGYIVTGHGAVEAAKRAGWASVPVDYQDFKTPADEFAHLLCDNSLPELAELDQAQLSSLLAELETTDNFDLDLTGFHQPTIDEAALPEWPEQKTTDAHIITIKYQDADEAAILAFIGKNSIEPVHAGKQILRRIKALATAGTDSKADGD
jgi:hypothetical protein